MTEPPGLRIQIASAPYLPDMGRLVGSADTSYHLLFYQTAAQVSSGMGKSIFSAGRFKVHQMQWSTAPGCQFQWSSMVVKLNELSQCQSALAGYMAYEAGFAFENRWKNLPLPQSGYAFRYLQVPCWYEADHDQRTGRILSTDNCPSDQTEYLRYLVDQSANNESDIRPPVLDISAFRLDAVAEVGELDENRYIEAIERILADIYSGRYYELNFTQRFRYKSKRQPRQIFRELFSSLKPAHAFFADFGDQVICSASPELFLRKSGEMIITRPIKGSYRKQPSQAELDKLNAEHIMVVDLARNDIGRATDLSAVSVPELCITKSFGGLSHLESAVQGSSSFTWPQLLPATFPAASITGAPKVEVVRAIAEYEASPRNVYTGTCGWIWPNGDLDFNVAIRTLTATRETTEWDYELGAGGAIVADSVPKEEYRECLMKAAPMVSQLLRTE